MTAEKGQHDRTFHFRRCLTAFQDALFCNFPDVSGKADKKTRVKEKESHFQLPNTIDGCGAYLVRALAKQLCTCPISIFLCTFFEVNARLQQEIL